MRYKEHKIDSNGGVSLNYLIFDDDIDEIRSWKLCNSSLPISEVVYFTQIIILLFYYCFFDKILYFHRGCEESTLWLSLFLCSGDYGLPNLELCTR